MATPTRTTAYFAWAALIIALSCLVRAWVYPIITSDYAFFLSPWFEALRHHPGLSAFQHPFSDYAPLYLYILKLLTFLPVSSLFSIKTLSVIGDACIALFSFLILRHIWGGTRDAEACFWSAVIFATPTILINSSLWGQADALYAACVMGSVYALLLDRPGWASASLALGLCLKIQAIFFLPILVGYLLPRGRDLVYLLYIPLFFVLSIIPAWHAGGSFMYWLLIYSKQSAEYQWLSVSAQSLFAFVNPLPLSTEATHVFFYAGIIAASIASIALAVVLARTQPLRSSDVIFYTLVSTLLLPYLLPRMHERYFYLADITALLFAITLPRRWYVAILVVGASLVSYFPYLSQLGFSWMRIDLRIPSAVVLIVLCVLLHEWYARTHHFRTA